MRKNVLIVEDNPVLALNYAAVIEDGLDCATLLAASATQARSLLNAGVDLALLDVDVSDGVTYPLAARLMERGIPTIFMSGSDPTRVPRELAKVPFLKKPVLPSELLSAAQRYL
jgi:CheY-like chemotaxis protein